MWYEDLAECDYFGKRYSKILTAIGWLKNGTSFTTGQTPPNIYQKLCEFNKTPLIFGRFRGYHQCDICNSENARGDSNIFIPHKGKIYVCPELITHYIEKHSCRPPEEFLEAVLACPSLRSMDYRRKILENGVRKLIKAIFRSK